MEISDGRISRLHCIIQTESVPNLPFSGRMLGPASIEDHSANGTFLNGERLPRGERTALSNLDSISLVMSLSPMVEKTFLFHTGILCQMSHQLRMQLDSFQEPYVQNGDRWRRRKSCGKTLPDTLEAWLLSSLNMQEIRVRWQSLCRGSGQTPLQVRTVHQLWGRMI